MFLYKFLHAVCMSLDVSTISSYFLYVLVAGACDAVACADGAAAVDFPRWEPQAK